MDIRQEILDHLATLRGRGTPENRTVAAVLICAYMHYEFQHLRRELRQHGYDACVYEELSKICLRVEGRIFFVQRLTGQSELVVQSTGFRHNIQERVQGVPGLPPAACAVFASGLADAVLRYLLDDLAREV